MRGKKGCRGGEGYHGSVGVRWPSGRTGYRSRAGKRFLAPLVPLAVAITLAGCGSSAKSISSKSLPTTTTTVTLPTTTESTVAVPPATTATTLHKPSTSTTTPTATTRPAASGQISLTMADNFRTVPVSRGQTVELTLTSSGQIWKNLEVTPAGLLAPDPSPSPPANGILAIWTAVAPGTVKLSAIGTANCSGGQICPDYVLEFSVTLVIS